MMSTLFWIGSWEVLGLFLYACLYQTSVFINSSFNGAYSIFGWFLTLSSFLTLLGKFKQK